MVSLRQIENYLKKSILPELERGRPGFDKPHSQAVVKKIKEILEHNPHLVVDRAVLIIAAYAHDWGYVDLFKKNKLAQIDEVRKTKSKHMEIGAKKLRRLLAEPFFYFLKKSQKERAIKLVRIHDNLEDLREIDELILLEADVLGALDANLVKPSYDFESNEKFIKEIREEKLPMFINDFSKRQAEKLIKQRKKYYQKKYKRT